MLPIRRSTPFVAAIAGGPPIDPGYRIDRERQFDLARPWGLTWLTHYGLIPNFQSEE